MRERERGGNRERGREKKRQITSERQETETQRVRDSDRETNLKGCREEKGMGMGERGDRQEMEQRGRPND